MEGNTRMVKYPKKPKKMRYLLTSQSKGRNKKRNL